MKYWLTNTCVTLASAIALLVCGVPALAHHAFSAEFDAKKPIHLEGVVTKVELINPHAWIHLDVQGPDGKVSSWMIEAGSPNVLLRRGFTKNTVAPGTRVVVDGYQAKDSSLRANGRDITLPDGRKLFLGSSGTGAPYDDPLANIAPFGAGVMLGLWLFYNKHTAEKISACGADGA
jgi:hypothetical protein